MTERLRGGETAFNMEKARLMGVLVACTAAEIGSDLAGGNLKRLGKKAVFREAMSNLPPELKTFNLEMIGDNWSWRDPGTEREEAIMPGPTASIALVEKDSDGNIISCAATIVGGWRHAAVIAGKEGVFVHNSAGSLIKARGTIDATYLDQPPQVYFFGQKFTDYWVAMGHVTGEMNRRFRTINDMGLYHVLRSFFDNFEHGNVKPINAVFIEPNNKFKNEVPVFIVNQLKKTVTPNEIQIRDMRMNDAYDNGHYRKSGGEYDSVGYVIATTNSACGAVMSAFRDAVLGNSDFEQPSDDPRFARLRQELQNWKK